MSLPLVTTMIHSNTGVLRVARIIQCFARIIQRFVGIIQRFIDVIEEFASNIQQLVCGVFCFKGFVC